LQPVGGELASYKEANSQVRKLFNDFDFIVASLSASRREFFAIKSNREPLNTSTDAMRWFREIMKVSIAWMMKSRGRTCAALNLLTCLSGRHRKPKKKAVEKGRKSRGRGELFCKHFHEVKHEIKLKILLSPRSARSNVFVMISAPQPCSRLHSELHGDEISSRASEHMFAARRRFAD
jgi:hypothetical protein